VIERIPRSVLVGAVLLAPLMLVYLAYSRPGYFNSQLYLSALVFLEFLFGAIWLYRQVFFPVVLMAFLFAGTGLQIGSGWTVARWVVLAIGALVGCAIVVKDRRLHFGWFHAVALFAAMAALLSGVVSKYPDFALLKALSLLLLFIYSATGARLAVAGREPRFFAGLLIGCELFVVGLAGCYLLGREVMGNPNSLGVVTGVVGAPILLWGTMVAQNPYVRHRRFALLAVCLYMVYHSQARASLGAAGLTCTLLCIAMRRYKLLARGLLVILILVGTVAIVSPETFSREVSNFSSSVVYKSPDPTRSFLASRESPWQGAQKTIHNNFWFGTGFGTTDNGQDASARLDQFTTNPGVTAENGSSYLAIFAWVGMLGVLPFLILLLAILGKVVRTTVWMFRTGSPFHPAIPLAMVMIGGLFHAGFEDWLFAPGYYVCVFFWSLAFILVDVAPATPLPVTLSAARPPWLRYVLGDTVPSQ
jgi:hypothetical protein